MENFWILLAAGMLSLSISGVGIELKNIRKILEENKKNK